MDESSCNEIEITTADIHVQETLPFLGAGADGRDVKEGRKQPFCKVGLSFLALVILHVLLALSFRLAQRKSSADYAFSSPALLVMAEMTKFVISMCLYCQEKRMTTATDNTIREWLPGIATKSRSFINHIVHHIQAEVSPKLIHDTIILAGLYCINNNIAFAVFRIADGANINLIKSGSSFVSALMLRCALKRLISPVQWSSIFLQVFGLVVTQFGVTCSRTLLLPGHTYLLLSISLFISSGCSVYNDHMLKRANRISMHTINMLLYGFGFLMNGAVYVYTDYHQGHFFSGFDEFPTYFVLLCQALFGMAVSAVYKFSDAIVKTFALSCATSILLFIHIFLFDMPFSLVATMGCFTVFVATHLYVTNPFSREKSHGVLNAH